MILINLLPSELRVKETRKINIPYRPIAVVIFSIFVVIALYNLFLFIRIHEQHRGLLKQWKGLEERSKQAEVLERELGATIATEVDFYDNLVDPPLETAQVLNFVSDLIPDGVWLTQLDFKRQNKELHLQLNGLSRTSGRATKLVEIQNFANGLKDKMEETFGVASQANPSMKKKIKAVVSTSSQRGEGEEAEVTQFTVSLKTEKFEQK